MARPNIDLDRYVIGGMRDYADREGIEVDEAYRRFLTERLQAEGILPGDSDSESKAGSDAED